MAFQRRAGWRRAAQAEKDHSRRTAVYDVAEPVGNGPAPAAMSGDGGSPAAQGSVPLMLRSVRLAALLSALASAVPAVAAEPVLGLWKAENGETVSVRPCPAGFCGRIESGPYKGSAIGTVAAPGPDYKGKINDPRSGKVYTGSMLVTGDRLDLKGCLMEVFCKTVQTWKRARP